MKPPLPRKWARRVLAIRISATLMGCAVAVVLVSLLALLYWLNAKAPMRDPAKMFERDAPAWMILRFVAVSQARDVSAGVLDAATRGMPAPAAKLVEKGVRDPSCPVAVVISVAPGGQVVKAVSLGKYPGLFRLVQRDLERRVESRALPYAVKYHSRAPIFFTEGAEPSGLLPLAVSGTAFVQSSDTAAIERLLDWMRDPVPVPLDYPDGTSCTLYARGWPLLAQLAGDFAPQWRDALESVGEDLPVVGRLETISFEGNAAGGGLYLAAATPEDAAAVAKELPEWLEKNPLIGSVVLKAGKVETAENRVTIVLTVTPQPPARPAPIVPQ